MEPIGSVPEAGDTEDGGHPQLQAKEYRALVQGGASRSCADPIERRTGRTKRCRSRRCRSHGGCEECEQGQRDAAYEKECCQGHAGQDGEGAYFHGDIPLRMSEVISALSYSFGNSERNGRRFSHFFQIAPN